MAQTISGPGVPRRWTLPCRFPECSHEWVRVPESFWGIAPSVPVTGRTKPPARALPIHVLSRQMLCLFECHRKRKRQNSGNAADIVVINAPVSCD